MTARAAIENRISSARKYLTILERYKKYSREEIEHDVDIRGMVERYLYLAVQSAIDLSEAVISHKKLRKPTTMSESFSILEEQGLITRDLSARLTGMVGFRNIIAHDYEELDYDIVYDVLHKRLQDIEAFLDIITSVS
jgi:uncharacterized protein YutE (UPF0331/DUF86 family)